MGKGLQKLSLSFIDTRLTHFGDLIILQRFCSLPVSTNLTQEGKHEHFIVIAGVTTNANSSEKLSRKSTMFVFREFAANFYSQTPYLQGLLHIKNHFHAFLRLMIS